MSHKTELLEYLSANVEPLSGALGPRYAAAAVLTDGTFLPRVIFRSNMGLDATAERLRKWSDDAVKFRGILSAVAKRNYIEAKYVARVEKSPVATPPYIYRLLEDPIERMEYANFALEMRDGVAVYFDIEDVEEFSGPPVFINLPEKYSFKDVCGVRPCVHAPSGEAVSRYGKEPVFFCCLSPE